MKKLRANTDKPENITTTPQLMLHHPKYSNTEELGNWIRYGYDR
jgi:hypothetical protein